VCYVCAAPAPPRRPSPPAGAAARHVAKYRPACPTLLLTSSLRAARSMAPVFGVFVTLVDALPASRFDVRAAARGMRPQ
jgi:pyruvate kinase